MGTQTHGPTRVSTRCGSAFNRAASRQEELSCQYNQAPALPPRQYPRPVTDSERSAPLPPKTGMHSICAPIPLWAPPPPPPSLCPPTVSPQAVRQLLNVNGFTIEERELDIPGLPQWEAVIAHRTNPRAQSVGLGVSKRLAVHDAYTRLSLHWVVANPPYPLPMMTSKEETSSPPPPSHLPVQGEVFSFDFDQNAFDATVHPSGRPRFTQLSASESPWEPSYSQPPLEPQGHSPAMQALLEAVDAYSIPHVDPYGSDDSPPSPRPDDLHPGVLPLPEDVGFIFSDLEYYEAHAQGRTTRRRGEYVPPTRLRPSPPRPQTPPTEPLDIECEGMLKYAALYKRGDVDLEFILTRMSARDLKRMLALLDKVYHAQVEEPSPETIPDASKATGFFAGIKDSFLQQITSLLESILSARDYIKGRSSALYDSVTSLPKYIADRITSFKEASLKTFREYQANWNTMKSSFSAFSELSDKVSRIKSLAAGSWDKIFGVLLAAILALLSTQMTNPVVVFTFGLLAGQLLPPALHSLFNLVAAQLSTKPEPLRAQASTINQAIAEVLKFLGMSETIHPDDEVRSLWSAISGLNSLTTLLSRLFSFIARIYELAISKFFVAFGGYAWARKLLSVPSDLEAAQAIVSSPNEAFDGPDGVTFANEYVKCYLKLHAKLIELHRDSSQPKQYLAITQALLAAFRVRLNKAYSRSTRMQSDVQPTGVWFIGPSGICKSSMLIPFVANALLKRVYGVPMDTSNTFNLVQQDERFPFAGYYDQQVIVLNDFFNQNDKEVTTSRLNTLIDLGSGNPIPVASPVAEEKGHLKLSHKLFLLSDNEPNLNSNLTNPEAVDRRVFIYKVATVPNPNGETITMDAWFNNAKFMRGKFTDKKITYDDRRYFTLAEVMDELIAAMTRRREEFVTSASDVRSAVDQFCQSPTAPAPPSETFAAQGNDSDDEEEFSDTSEVDTSKPSTLTLYDHKFPTTPLNGYKGRSPNITPPEVKERRLRVFRDIVLIVMKERNRDVPYGGGKIRPDPYQKGVWDMEDAYLASFYPDMFDDVFRYYAENYDVLRTESERAHVPRTDPEEESQHLSYRLKKLIHAIKFGIETLHRYGLFDFLAQAILYTSVGAILGTAFVALSNLVFPPPPPPLTEPQGYDTGLSHRTRPVFKSVLNTSQSTTPAIIPQAYNLAKSSDFRDRILRNQAKIKVLVANATGSYPMSSFALFINARWFATSAHMLATAFHPEQIEHSTIELFLSTGKTLIYPVKRLKYYPTGTDIFLVQLDRDVHHVRDISHSFITDAELGILRAQNFPYLHRGWVATDYSSGAPAMNTHLETTPFFKMQSVSVSIPGSDATVTSPVAIQCRLPGRDGDCGMPYVDLSTHSQSTIVGLHSAGSEYISVCSVLTREKLLAVIGSAPLELVPQAKILPIPEGHAPLVPVPPTTLGILAEPSAYFVSTPVHSSFTTSSTVDAGVRKCIKRLAHLRPYIKTKEAEIVPLHRVLTSCGRLPLDYRPAADARRVLDFYHFNEWVIPGSTRSVLTEEEVAREQDMTKSVGGYRQYIRREPKRAHFVFAHDLPVGFKPYLREDVEKIEQALVAEGNFGYVPLFSHVIKDEPLDPIKVTGTPGVSPSDARSRAIIPCPLPLNLIGVKYFKRIFEFIHANAPHHLGIIGSTPAALHELAATVVRKNLVAKSAGYEPTISDIDLAKCDISTPLPASNFCAEYFALIGKRLDVAHGLTQEEVLKNYLIRRNFIENFGHPTVITQAPFRTPEGSVVIHHIVYETVALVSGSPQTADANNCTWHLGIYQAAKNFGFSDFEEFSQHVTMLTYSDDALFCTHTDRLSAEDFVNFHNSGILPKAQIGKPAIAANGNVAPALLQRIITGHPPRFALREESIASALTFVTRTQSKDEATRSNYENALRYYADYGKFFYDKKLFELNFELSAAGIAPIDLSWEEALIR